MNELEPITISPARRAGMRSTEHATQVPTFLVSRRLDLGPAIERRGTSGVTATEVLVVAAAAALAATPAVHTCLVEGRPQRYVSTRIAVLVRSGDALIPLVFPDAETMTATQVRAERRRLQELLADGHLPADRMMRPTFVISNLGRFEVDWFSAVLFPDTAATLAVGTAGATGCAPHEVHAVLTCDHRLIDGVDGAQFLANLAAAIPRVAID